MILNHIMDNPLPPITLSDPLGELLQMGLSSLNAGSLKKGQVIVFESSARTSSENSSDITNEPQEQGVRLYLDITAASGTSPTLDLKVQTKDAVSGNYYDLPGASFAQKTTTGSDDLTIYPGIAETANESVSDVLGTTWRVVATIGGTTPSFTFSLGADYL